MYHIQIAVQIHSSVNMKQFETLQMVEICSQGYNFADCFKIAKFLN